MSQEGKYLDAFGKALYDTIFLIADNVKHLKACVGICHVLVFALQLIMSRFCM
jgi:hypothetical protein